MRNLGLSSLLSMAPAWDMESVWDADRTPVGFYLVDSTASTCSVTTAGGSVITFKEGGTFYPIRISASITPPAGMDVFYLYGRGDAT